MTRMRISALLGLAMLRRAVPARPDRAPGHRAAARCRRRWAPRRRTTPPTAAPSPRWARRARASAARAAPFSPPRRCASPPAAVQPRGTGEGQFGEPLEGEMKAIQSSNTSQTLSLGSLALFDGGARLRDLRAAREAGRRHAGPRGRRGDHRARGREPALLGDRARRPHHPPGRSADDQRPRPAGGHARPGAGGRARPHRRAGRRGHRGRAGAGPGARPRQRPQGAAGPAPGHGRHRGRLAAPDGRAHRPLRPRRRPGRGPPGAAGPGGSPAHRAGAGRAAQSEQPGGQRPRGPLAPLQRGREPGPQPALRQLLRLRDAPTPATRAWGSASTWPSPSSRAIRPRTRSSPPAPSAPPRARMRARSGWPWSATCAAPSWTWTTPTARP